MSEKAEPPMRLVALWRGLPGSPTAVDNAVAAECISSNARPGGLLPVDNRGTIVENCGDVFFLPFWCHFAKIFQILQMLAESGQFLVFFKKRNAIPNFCCRVILTSVRWAHLFDGSRGPPRSNLPRGRNPGRVQRRSGRSWKL